MLTDSLFCRRDDGGAFLPAKQKEQSMKMKTTALKHFQSVARFIEAVQSEWAAVPEQPSTPRGAGKEKQRGTNSAHESSAHQQPPAKRSKH